MSPAERRCHESSCPIAKTLDVLGDRWTLLVLRDFLFLGKRRFSEFAGSPEGIASNVLSDRLRRLEEEGLAESEPDPEDGRRVLYRPTEKAADLIPLLLDMIEWGMKHESGANAPKRFVDRLKKDRAGLIDELRTVAREG